MWQIADTMQQAPVIIRKPLLFLLTGAILFLCAAVGLLYHEKRTVQQENRQLIIQNDSILSVNIELADSVRQKTVPAALKNLSLAQKAGLK